MSNRRGRNRRSKSKRILGMSNTVFYTIISILTVIILVCIFLLYVFDKRDRRKTAEEQERVREQVEQIYETTNKEIGELDNYKTNSIIRISAVGDILCGKNLETYGKDYDFIFSDVSKYFKDSDLKIGTYETDTNDNKKQFAESLKKSGINLVSLAHNHALDYGKEGLDSTKEYLESIEMETVGVSAETSEDRVKIIEKKGTKLAILAYTYDNGKEGVSIYSEDTVKQDLEYAEQNAAVSIVMMHWGNVNTNKVSDKQKEQANFLIENGADIVIGAHPSAVQEMEMIENEEGEQCFVAYSLGDYTSDFESEMSNLELILNIQIFVDKEGNASIYKVDYTPIYMNDFGTKLKENRFKILDMKKEILNYGTDESEIDKKTYEKLLKGIEKLKQIIEKE